MKAINVTIQPDGSVKIESTGFQGSACALATREIERALGVATSDVKKPEWHQQNQNQQKAGR